MNIKNIKLKHGLFLAPVAGVSDNAFRQVCREQGAEYTATEMISAKAVNFKNAKTLKLAYTTAAELPLSVQIFGSDAPGMAYAASYICDNFKLSAIDINMGCPMPKIVGEGDGSALMRDPVLAGRIMEAVVKAAEAYGVPVTVKCRSGWDERKKNAPQIAKIAEAEGIAAIFVHGRTKEKMYAPPADFDIIREVKESVNIPVVGNGDIFSAADAKKMKDQTGCDGIMVARGAFGNPWIFGEIAAYFENRGYNLPTGIEKINTIKKHMEQMIFFKGEKTAAMEARKHLSWYIKGYKDSAAARNTINRASDYREMIDTAEAVILKNEEK